MRTTRFISQYPGFHPQIRPQRQRALGDGGVEVTQQPLYVKFASVHDGAFIFESELVTALKHFTFHGNTQDQGESMPTDPVLRLSLCDTDELAEREQWTDEERRLVENRLAELAAVSPDQLLVVAAEPLTAPYPAYDNDDRETLTIVIRLIEDGHDLDKVLAYERTGPQRPELVAQLEEAIEQRKLLEIPA